MEFSLTYLLNNITHTIDKSDENVIINKKINKNSIFISIIPKCKIIIKNAIIEKDYKFNKDDKIFVNGYQSWTETKEFSIKESLRNINHLPKFILNKYSFKNYGDSFFKKYQKHVLHSFDISYIKSKNELFIASYNIENTYLIINHNIKKNKIIFESDCEDLEIEHEFTLFNFIIYNSIEEGREKYFNNSQETPQIIGYSSWYNHYQNINEEKILYSLNNIDKRFNLFQIDDGFETFVGDWLNIDKNKFPNGLKEIVNKIHSKNLYAGIWLAPFVVEEKSEIYKRHKNWLLKDKLGNLIKAGSNWSNFYPLDLENADVKNYITKCLQYYISLGFDFFKLDFLYAISLQTPSNKTRAQVNNEAYKFLKNILKNKLVLGCGAILSSSINIFDYLRIGPDVSLSFDDVWYMKYMHRERISTKVTIQNTIYRSIFNNHFFGNDPDVFLLRDNNMKLILKQREALTIINALFGNVFLTSDDTCEYDEKKKEILERALEIKKYQPIVHYENKGRYIEIKYSLNNKNYFYKYDTKKGILL